jgi:adenylate kinase
MCPSCEVNYHLHIEAVMPKIAGQCDRCRGALTARGDDTAATIDRRLDSYDTKTMPNVALFQQKGLLLTVGEKNAL